MKVLWKSGIYGYTNGSAAAPESCPKNRAFQEVCLKAKAEPETKGPQPAEDTDQKGTGLAADVAEFTSSRSRVELDLSAVAVFQSAEEIRCLIAGNEKSRMAG